MCVFLLKFNPNKKSIGRSASKQQFSRTHRGRSFGKTSLRMTVSRKRTQNDRLWAERASEWQS